MSLTHTRLKAASGQMSWKPDVELFVISGFIARSHPGLDPDQFTDTTSEYADKSGLPIDLIIKLFCYLIDEGEAKLAKDTVSPFAEYLAVVMSESRRLVAASTPAAPVASAAVMEVSVPSEVTDEITGVLKSDRPLTDVEMGDAIFRWNAKLDTDHELYLDVINADPSPALSVTVTKNKKTACRHRPLRIKQWNELSSNEAGKKISLAWTGGQLLLTFCG